MSTGHLISGAYTAVRQSSQQALFPPLEAIPYFHKGYQQRSLAYFSAFLTENHLATCYVVHLGFRLCMCAVALLSPNSHWLFAPSGFVRSPYGILFPFEKVLYSPFKAHTPGITHSNTKASREASYRSYLIVLYNCVSKPQN